MEMKRKYFGDYSFILKAENLFITSPIKGIDIVTFNNDVIEYANKYLSEKDRKRVYDKYKELESRLYIEKYNPHYREARILNCVLLGNDDLSKYDNVSLFALYEYFKNEYSRQLSYKKKDISILKEEFKKVISKDKFEGLYDFSIQSSISSWVNDVLEKKHIPTEEELMSIEDVYNTLNKTLQSRVRKVYKDVIAIGGTLGFDKETKYEEIKKLSKLIESKEFNEKYNREFDLVDLYLTTNLKPEDILPNLYDIGNLEECKTVSLWIEKVLRYTCKGNPVIGKNSWYAKIATPSLKVLNDFQNNEFSEYYAVNHDEEDLIKAYTTLYDLNQKYGVKFDQFNYIYILKQVVFKNVESYYAVAEDYKEELDILTHVEKTDNPILTRRVKNK